MKHINKLPLIYFANKNKNIFLNYDKYKIINFNYENNVIWVSILIV